MKKDSIEAFILKLDGMIAAMRQAIVIGGRTRKEREACDLLVEARLKLVEDLEGMEHRHAVMHETFEADKNYYSSWGLNADE